MFDYQRICCCLQIAELQATLIEFCYCRNLRFFMMGLPQAEASASQT
jgi:hypothetical protein